jgi:Tfp pilus assembly protein PilO
MSKGKGRLITSIILVLLLNGLALMTLIYLFSMVKEESALAIQQKEKLALNEKEIGNVRALRALGDELVGENEAIKSFFLKKDNVIEFVEELEFLARETGVGIKIGNANIDSTAKGLKIQLNLEGEFQQILQYLILMEHLPRLVQAERMNIRKAGDVWQGSFEVSLKGLEEI